MKWTGKLVPIHHTTEKMNAVMRSYF